MELINDITNATIEQIKSELVSMIDTCENSEEFQNGEYFGATIFIRFNDDCFLTLIPTWWNMGMFSGYHYSDTNDGDNWLDDDDDLGEISDSENWLDETVAFIQDHMDAHGGVAYLLSTTRTEA